MIQDEADDVEEVEDGENDDDEDAEEAESSKEAQTWLIVRVAGERTLDRRLQKILEWLSKDIYKIDKTGKKIFDNYLSLPCVWVD